MNLGGSSIPNPATDFLKAFKPSPNGRVRFVGTAVIDGHAAYVINFTGLHEHWPVKHWLLGQAMPSS
jgi:hypothetical protein